MGISVPPFVPVTNGGTIGRLLASHVHGMKLTGKPGSECGPVLRGEFGAEVMRAALEISVTFQRAEHAVTSEACLSCVHYASVFLVVWLFGCVRCSTAPVVIDQSVGRADVEADPAVPTACR